MLDVGRLAVGVELDVRRPVEVRHGRGQPGGARVVGEHPAHRMGRREHPSPARTQNARHLAHHARGVGNERDGAECRERDVEGRVRERQELCVGLHERHRNAGRAGEPAGMAEHPRGQVERDRPGALRRQPSRAHCRAASDFEGAQSTDRAEQPRVGFAQPLRAPHEIGSAEELAVQGVVVVRIGVPPAPVGANRRGRVGVAAGDAHGVQLGRMIAHATAAAAARPATRPENRQPPRNVPSRAR